MGERVPVPMKRGNVLFMDRLDDARVAAQRQRRDQVELRPALQPDGGRDGPLVVPRVSWRAAARTRSRSCGTRASGRSHGARPGPGWLSRRIRGSSGGTQTIPSARRGRDSPSQTTVKQICGGSPVKQRSNKSAGVLQSNNGQNKLCGGSPVKQRSNKLCGGSPVKQRSNKLCGGSPVKQRSNKICGGSPVKQRSNKLCRGAPVKQRSSKLCRGGPSQTTVKQNSVGKFSP